MAAVDGERAYLLHTDTFTPPPTSTGYLKLKCIALTFLAAAGGAAIGLGKDSFIKGAGAGGAALAVLNLIPDALRLWHINRANQRIKPMRMTTSVNEVPPSPNCTRQIQELATQCGIVTTGLSPEQLLHAIGQARTDLVTQQRATATSLEAVTAAIAELEKVAEPPRGGSKLQARIAVLTAHLLRKKDEDMQKTKQLTEAIRTLVQKAGITVNASMSLAAQLALVQATMDHSANSAPQTIVDPGLAAAIDNAAKQYGLIGENPEAKLAALMQKVAETETKVALQEEQARNNLLQFQSIQTTVTQLQQEKAQLIIKHNVAEEKVAHFEREKKGLQDKIHTLNAQLLRNEQEKTDLIHQKSAATIGATEKLGEAQASLHVKTAELESTRRQLAETTQAHDGAAEKLGQVQASLQAKTTELESTRKQLEETEQALTQAISERDRWISTYDDRVQMYTELFLQVCAKLEEIIHPDQGSIDESREGSRLGISKLDESKYKVDSSAYRSALQLVKAVNGVVEMVNNVSLRTKRGGSKSLDVSGISVATTADEGSSMSGSVSPIDYRGRGAENWAEKR